GGFGGGSVAAGGAVAWFSAEGAGAGGGASVPGAGGLGGGGGGPGARGGGGRLGCRDGSRRGGNFRHARGGRGGWCPAHLHLYLTGLEQFEVRRLAAVAEAPLVPLHDPRVAARSVGVARRDFGEQLGEDFTVVGVGV